MQGVVLWKTSLSLSLLQRSGTVLLKGAVSYVVTSRKVQCVMLCDAKGRLVAASGERGGVFGCFDSFAYMVDCVYQYNIFTQLHSYVAT